VSQQAWQSTAQVPADEQVFLIGRPPLSEYLGFLTGQTVEGQGADTGALADQWRHAHDRIRELEQTETGWADGGVQSPVPASLEGLREHVLGDAIVQRTFAVVPIDVAMVELDRMVVFQKHVDVAYVRQLQQLLGTNPTPEEILSFCLPVDRRYDPPVQIARLAQNAWVLTSPSNDFRALEPVLLDPAQVPTLATTGAPTALVALVVGYGSNYLTAIDVEGRILLQNGSHRAYALRDAGHTHVPCLIQRASRREELEVILGGEHEVNRKPELFLEAARPPLLKDYFDPQLRMIVHVPRTVRQLRVAVNFEASDVPTA
jgi:hypothetical protein